MIVNKKSCPICNEVSLVKQSVTNYEYQTPMGMLMIEGKIQLAACQSCGEVLVPGQLIDRWNRSILKFSFKEKGNCLTQ
jgi:YgiT-type zinc finger domain-containing protein